jgi:RHS repeat-associated protein
VAARYSSGSEQLRETYTYYSIGNMTQRTDDTSTRTLTWDVENRLTQVQDTGGQTSTFAYDGDGARIKKTENGETVVYINRYYQKNVTTGEATAYYYLDDRLVALKGGFTLEYIHQDHLGSTVLSTDSAGDEVSDLEYNAYGSGRSDSGTLGTDKRYTGQRLDGAGLYFYGARYYDSWLGRFISPDPVTQSAPLPFGQLIGALTVSQNGHPFGGGPKPSTVNPQEHNRYTYALNNPLRYTDPDGNQQEWALTAGGLAVIPGWGWAAAGVGVLIYGGIRLEQETGIFTKIGGAVSSWWNSLFRSDQSSSQGQAQKREWKKGDPLPDDPSQPPGKDWEWRGKGPQGSSEGNWYNPKTGESLHPDLSHAGPEGPHWDYKDPNGEWWRVGTDGTMTPKH